MTQFLLYAAGAIVSGAVWYFYPSGGVKLSSLKLPSLGGVDQPDEFKAERAKIAAQVAALQAKDKELQAAGCKTAEGMEAKAKAIREACQ